MSLLLTICNFFAGCMLLSVLWYRVFTHSRETLELLGIWLCALGLLLQSLRSFSLYRGIDMPFAELPIWVVKDFGIWVLLLHYLLTLWGRR